MIVRYQYMENQHKEIEKALLNIEEKIAKLPKGKLCCAKNGTGVKWYVYKNNERIYIKKKQKKLAEQLAYKKYLEKHKKELQKEKNAIEMYLRHAVNKENSEAEQLMTKDSYYRSLILPYYKPLDEKLREWQEASYEKCTKHPEELTRESASGRLLRSKSEADIDTALFNAKIPFRYECAKYIGDIVIYPDFTIIHPITRKIYYWEHFGIMDDPDYVKKTFSKLNLYYSNGIVPSINLIMTFETKANPLSKVTIEKVIDQYFR